MNQTLSPRMITRLQPVFLGGVVLLALLLSVAAGYAAYTGRTILLLPFIALPVAVFGIWFVTQRFTSGVLLIAPAALAIPFSVPTGTQTLLPVSLLLSMMLCGVWVIAMILHRQWLISSWQVNAPSAWFCVVCCISLVWGTVWRDPVLISMGRFIFVQTAALLAILMSFGAALLVGNFVNSERHIKWIVGAFLVCGSLMTITQLLGVYQPFLNDRGLWGMWVVGISYGLVIGVPRMHWALRLALVVLLIATLYLSVVVNAAWVSGWVPALIAMMAITFLHSRKWFAVLLLVAAIIGYGQLVFFQEVAQENIDDGSLERITLWEQNWKVVSQHWLFGTGPAGYAVYYMTYYRDDARSTHNNYLDILAQFGFAGMATWLWVAGALLYEGWKVIHRLPMGFLRSVALIATGGWFGAQVAMFFGDWVLPFAYNQGVAGFRYTVYTWIFAGLLLSIKRILDARERSNALQL